MNRTLSNPSPAFDLRNAMLTYGVLLFLLLFILSLYTLVHEGGHALHAMACRHDPILSYRHGPMEFCEVASMGMELLGGDHLREFYSAEDEERSVVAHLEGIVYILIWVAIVDAFQH